jgi:hypothetical protein
VSAERRNGRIVGTGPFGRFGRHLVQNRNNLDIYIDGTGHSRRPALAGHQNDCHLATAEWFQAESIIGDLPKHEAPVPQVSIPAELLQDAALAGVPMGEQSDATA